MDKVERTATIFIGTYKAYGGIDRRTRYRRPIPRWCAIRNTDKYESLDVAVIVCAALDWSPNIAVRDEQATGNGYNKVQSGGCYGIQQSQHPWRLCRRRRAGSHLSPGHYICSVQAAWQALLDRGTLGRV